MFDPEEKAREIAKLDRPVDRKRAIWALPREWRAQMEKRVEIAFRRRVQHGR